MRRIRIGAVTLIAAVIGITGPVAADPAPEEAAKYRQSIMKALSGHNGAIRAIARGSAGDPDRLASHVEALVNLASEVHAVFQEGSDVEDSSALPAIWENADAFADVVANFEAAADALSDVPSDDLAAVDAAQRELGTACRGCHDDFRADDD